MKRTYLFGTIVAFSLAAASVGAQQDRPTPSASDQADKSVVVTGCLKSGSQLSSATATGTAGTTGTSGASASAASSFILADAKLAPAGSGSATGTASSTATTGTATTGTSGSAATAGKDKAKSFALVGGTPSELQGYINSKVEITGTIDPSASASSASGSPATGSTASGAASTMPGMAHASDHPKLKVTSVRQVAANCDPAQQ